VVLTTPSFRGRFARGDMQMLSGHAIGDAPDGSWLRSEYGAAALSGLLQLRLYS
jgi:hypothetical protein